MDLHILVGHPDGVGWRLVLIYMRTPPTHYYLKSSGRVAYMETHPLNMVRCVIIWLFSSRQPLSLVRYGNSQVDAR